MNKKVLIIANHRKDRSPGQRYRIEQYLNYLSQNGYDIHFSNLLNAKEDKLFYAKGSLLGKAWVILKAWVNRFLLIFKANRFDIIFIYREAFFTGSTFFEKQYKRFSKAKIILDFDDSIWIDTVSSGNKRFAWLKDARKTSKLIKLSDSVFAGNEYLAQYSRKYNDHVFVVPTTIDMDVYRLKEKRKENQTVCIGWTGSFSTIEHFETILPVLKAIKLKYGPLIRFKLIGDESYHQQDLDIHGIAWNSRDEVKELSELDIGIMPLPDNEWTKGKCGCKGLQYMALGIATVMSPVGVNTDIIEDGVNGFLAKDEQDWIEKLSRLIEAPELRKSMGAKGKVTVEERYSVHANKERYLNLFNELVQ